jgi:hypothetical protein
MTSGQRTIVFTTNHLSVRGTDVSMYDYAHYAETLLGHRSLIVSPSNADNSELDRFAARFPVTLLETMDDLEHLLRIERADAFYTQIHGAPQPLPSTGARTLVHAVFQALTPFGDVYAAISDWLVDHHSHGSLPVVPLIVHLPDEPGDLRDELEIPRGAVVFGRHGALETFDVPFVRDVVTDVAARHPDRYFVLLNTERFADHPRIIHLDATSDVVRKTRFINTCDAMLHARVDGETFGLAVAEFSIRNKPVLTWIGGTDKCHIRILFGKGGIFYTQADDLRELLETFRPEPGDYDCYSRRFNPATVMRQFEEVFLLRD